MNHSQRRTGEQWRELICSQAASGLSIAAYCRREGISQPSFFVWRRRLADPEAPSGPAPRFIEVTASASNGRARARVWAIELRLRRGRRILLRRGFDRDLLVALVRTLEALA